MRMTMYTDYALRVLMYLGAKKDGELSTIQGISDAYGISKNHLMKITHKLGQLGYVETVRGRGGGVRLAVPPAEIKIGTIVRQTEDDFNIVECFSSTANQCVLSPVCGLRGALNQALMAYLAVLDQYTLADFLINKQDLAALLSGREI
ncbi:RrF2 family transcriptional regulator [Bhargavaea beijingensis]|uniref:HTH-type transcriptional regulator NsrR n=1 Tax=Bhargavaea beijingensis TaxID=426756 RepID=A0ABX9ZDD4_9BACL|nr:Rrf2 family transcriptional regulator [Bhargavaea beijingensis]MCW1927722.1 Rrf2 family transcriptional regulator [Bhargavaea beijingensis]RSK33379.1 Rrf2 family transcriptional regulator [Bhargavaea beijingensis]